MSEYPSTGGHEYRQTGFIVERIKGGEQGAGVYANEILSIYDKVFRGIYDPKAFSEGRDLLAEDLVYPEATFVLLREKPNEIAGFTYASPTLDLWPRTSRTLWMEFFRGRYTLPSFRKMQLDTAEVGFTAILPESRKNGGWSLMMAALDSAVREDSTYLTRYVRTGDHYDGTIGARYQGRVVYRGRDLGASKKDPHAYFRIKLK